MSTLLDTRVVEWTNEEEPKRQQLYLHLTDNFSEIRETAIALRKHHIPRGFEDKFDYHSYHLIAYHDDRAVACLRMTMALDHEIPNLRFYSKPALNYIAPYYSSVSRFYQLPNARLPQRAMVSMLQRSAELALRLGSALSVTNCAVRAVSYYRRRGCIIDKNGLFQHPTDDTQNYPIYVPGCHKNKSLVSPLMHLAQRHYDSELLRQFLHVEQVSTRRQTTSPWFLNKLAVPGAESTFASCSIASKEAIPNPA